MDHIVVDVEIQKQISEVPNGWEDTHLLGISTAVIYAVKLVMAGMRLYGFNKATGLNLLIIVLMMLNLSGI